MREESSVGEIEDIAVLELSSDVPLPAELQSAPIVRLDSGDKSFFAHQVQMCGFPAGIDDGTYAKGTLQDLTAKGWVEIHHQGLELVEEGFSGTAVWAIKESAVCGMIVSVLDRRNAATVAYMIPASTLFSAFPDMPLPVNPYKGLEAFREKDAHFYFGRDEAIAHLKKIPETQSFTAVIGASGSGKSSLVFAGLVPALRKSGDWLVADCRPLNQPFYELSVRLVSFLYEDPLQRSEKTEELKANFDAGTVSLSSVISQIRERHDRRRFLLIIDQFEELYTPNADKVLSRSFLSQVLEAAQTEGFSAVVTLRADFLAAAGSCGVFAGILNSSSPVFIPSIDKENLQQVVERPAALQHVAFEPGLVDLIVSEAGDSPGSLPLLEFCLTQLWEKQECRQITHAAYQDIGGVKNAIAVHADDVCNLFNAADRERVRHIFLKLVRPGQGTEDTRQAAVFAQFEPEYHGLIKRLADRRLLVTGQDAHSRESTVEIVHEALLHHWTTLREWVDKERNFLVWREKLKVLLRQWRESKQDDSALLRGLPLDEALRWRGSHAGYLAEEERRFVEESEAARVKQRRRKSTAFAAALLIAAVVVAVVLVLWKNAEQQRGVAERKTVEARYNVAKAFEGKALTALKTADKDGTEAYKKVVLFSSAALDQNVEGFGLSPDSTAVLFTAGVFGNSLAEQWISPLQQGVVRSVAFSPNGRYIASASDDKTVRIWDSTIGKEVNVLQGHTDSVWSVAFSPNGRQVVSASGDNTVRIWDVETSRELMALQGDKGVRQSVTISPDGKQVAATSSGQVVRIWDIETGKELVLIKEDSAVKSISFSPDGRLLALAYSGNKPVRILDTINGEEVKSLIGHNAYEVCSVSFSPDGKILASASWDFKFSIDNTVWLWDVKIGRELKVLKGHTDAVLSVSFSPDGSKIASASADKTVQIWDIANGTELKILTIPEAAVSVSFGADGKRVAVASIDKRVRILDSATDEEFKILTGHTKDIRSVSFDPDSKRIISASSDNTVKTWDIKTGKTLNLLQGHTSAVNSAIFSPDGKQIASCSLDHTVRLWDSETGRELHVLNGHSSYVWNINFSPDGNQLISGPEDDNLLKWDSKTGKILDVMKNRWHPGLCFSPDGKLIASSSGGIIEIWDKETGKELNELKGHAENNYVGGLVFNFDGERLASCSEDKTVRIWHTKTGNVLFVLKGHTDQVNNAAFSPDGKLLASVSNDKTVRLWDSKTGKEIGTLKGHRDTVYDVAFSPDGKWLASGSDDKTIRIWDMRSYTLFLHDSKPTPLYHTFIEAVKFLWQLDVQGLEIVHKERSPADMKRFGSLLSPPPPGQSKFDQVLEWAEKQQAR